MDLEEGATFPEFVVQLGEAVSRPYLAIQTEYPDSGYTHSTSQSARQIVELGTSAS